MGRVYLRDAEIAAVPEEREFKRARHEIVEVPRPPPATPLATDVAEGLALLLFGFDSDPDDRERWFQQAFTFADSNSNAPWGLQQDFGGPCGVLAAVQAYLLRDMHLAAQQGGTQLDLASQEDPLTELSAYVDARPERLRGHLASALCDMLVRCCSWTKPLLWAEVVTLDFIQVTEFSSPAELHKFLESASLSSPGAVLSFTCSLILTRGMESVRVDMDNPGQPLVGAFGHCTQELVNLCLIGSAASNVFDGEIKFEDCGDENSGDTISLKGVRAPCPVGYLTAMEALGLAEVGSYYKAPSYPIWVLGSSSHYTVLFGLGCAANHCTLPSTTAATNTSNDAVRAISDGSTASCAMCSKKPGCALAGAGTGTLYHYNGKVIGGDPVQVRRVALAWDGETHPKPLLMHDGDSDAVFREAMRTRWPGAQVTWDGDHAPQII
mmetsp:Transcript_16944/g.38802  ORF Transcript_16944/g.38802 Transcript_16944/m.38802 type:complete len:438 (+) Transcript_16944:78-1391(+)